jgi:hypothetical protein
MVELVAGGRHVGSSDHSAVALRSWIDVTTPIASGVPVPFGLIIAR